MWKKNKSRAGLQLFAGKTSVLAAGAELYGELRFQGAVQIDGLVKGSLLSSEGMVRISADGRLEGELRAPHIIIDGEVRGDVHASSRLELGPLARISGNLYYTEMEMASGAQVEGRLCRLSDEARLLELPHNLDVPE